jgi:hypothetical protein
MSKQIQQAETLIKTRDSCSIRSAQGKEAAFGSKIAIHGDF